MKNNILKNTQSYLFADAHIEKLGLMRFLLCAVLLYLAVFRQLNIDQFGISSLIPRADALSLYPEFYRPYFEYFFWPDSLAASVHGVLIVLLLLATLGLSNRPVLFLTWVLSQGFIHRNYSMLFGADVIGGLFLFYLSFTKCCDFFSVKSIILKKSKKPHDQNHFSDQLSSMFFRLMQIQICVIYMYTGFEKLKGNSWWDGTALWTVFANPQFSTFNLIWLKSFPLFFAVGTFSSVVFEIYFPAMMLNKKLRPYWLGLGLFFHLAIGISLSLMTFSLVMLSTYFLFLETEQIKNIILRLKIRQ